MSSHPPEGIDRDAGPQRPEGFAPPSRPGLALFENDLPGRWPGPAGARPAPNVLLVDDQPANLLALEGVLEPTGLSLFPASSGEDALRLALRHTFAVALIDVNLPGLDGFETASLLKMRPAQRATRVLLLSADTPPVEKLRAAARGGIAFVLKPFDPDALRERVVKAAETFVLHPAL